MSDCAVCTGPTQTSLIFLLCFPRHHTQAGRCGRACPLLPSHPATAVDRPPERAIVLRAILFPFIFSYLPRLPPCTHSNADSHHHAMVMGSWPQARHAAAVRLGHPPPKVGCSSRQTSYSAHLLSQPTIAGPHSPRRCSINCPTKEIALLALD